MRIWLKTSTQKLQTYLNQAKDCMNINQVSDTGSGLHAYTGELVVSVS
jgi:hypothetical protein